MAKIIAPNPDFNGTSASVAFSKGEGETSDPNLITWFLENGYAVEETEEVTEEAEEATEEAKTKPTAKKKAE